MSATSLTAPPQNAAPQNAAQTARIPPRTVPQAQRQTRFPRARRLFDGLAMRFSLLLLLALVGANAIAALLMAQEGSAFDRAVRLEGDLGRLVALVSSLEEVDSDTGAMIVAKSSTGFTRFSLDPVPIVPAGRASNPALLLNLDLALPGHRILAVDGTPPRGPAEGHGDGDGRGVLMLTAVQLNEGHYAGHWLNSLVYPLPAHLAWQWKWAFFAPLMASLIGTLLVGVLSIRRMTAPLKALAQAARDAGRGDRAVRVRESGPQEVRAAAVAFNDMQARIAAFDAERNRLVATIGHDLRTPIAGLMIRAELLDPCETRDAMIRSLHEMTVMTDELFDYVRDNRGGEPVQPVDLTALLRRLCNERGITLAPSPAAILPLRPVAMSRALNNLLGNALRYAGGARVALRLGEREVEVVIDDDGPGIPEADLGAVVEPFVRVEPSRNLDTGGLGLGLTIARDILVLHGGSLTLSNRPAGGLRARITLPLRLG